MLVPFNKHTLFADTRLRGIYYAYSLCVAYVFLFLFAVSNHSLCNSFPPGWHAHFLHTSFFVYVGLHCRLPVIDLACVCVIVCTKSACVYFCQPQSFSLAHSNRPVCDARDEMAHHTREQYYSCCVVHRTPIKITKWKRQI